MNKHKPTKMVPDSLLSNKNEIHQTQFLQQFDRQLSTLISLVGEPYYARDGYIIYKNSCTDFMRKIASHTPFIDLAITSPPYNIGKEYENKLAVDEYVEWCAEWMDLVHSITSAKSSFWLNVGHFEIPEKGMCVPIPYLIWDKSPFYLIQELVWHYGAGVQTKKRLSPRNEKWLFYVKEPKEYVFNLDEIRDPNVKYPNQKKNGKLRNNPLGKNPSDVWEIPKVTTGASRSSKERVDHPAQFPLAVIERLVRVSSNYYDTVYDPFSGSGTTGIAAHALGRIYIGCEINKKYCDVSIDRFERYLDYARNTDV